MNLSLLKGLEDDRKKELEAQYASCYLLREQIVKYAEAEVESIQRAMRELGGYEKASWGMYQADRLGQIRAYEKIISLFSS